MHRALGALAFLSMMMAPPVCLHAQLADLVPGVRVRLRAPDYQQRIDGTVIARTGDSLLVANSGGGQYRITASSLTSLELYRGRSASKGAKRGALWGAGISTVLGLLSLAVVDNSNEADSAVEAPLLLTAVVFYTGVGAGVGALIKADDWQPMRLRTP
jgi:hypothetical protein